MTCKMIVNQLVEELEYKKFLKAWPENLYPKTKKMNKQKIKCKKLTNRVKEFEQLSQSKLSMREQKCK